MARTLVLLVFLARGTALAATEGTQIDIDQGTGDVFVGGKRYVDGDTIRVAPGPVRIVVCGAVRTLYGHEVAQEPFEPKDVTALNTFLKETKPYLKDAVALPGALGTPPDLEALKEAVEQLEKLPGFAAGVDRYTSPSGTLTEVQNGSLLKLQRIARACEPDVDRSAEPAVDRKRCWTPKDNDACDAAVKDARGFLEPYRRNAADLSHPMFHLVKDVAVAQEALEDAWRHARSDIATVDMASANYENVKKNKEQWKDLLDRATRALDPVKKARSGAAEHLAAAADVEALAAAANDAGLEWEAPVAIDVPWNEGRKVTVKTSPSEKVLGGRLARLRSSSVTVKLAPDWPVRPSVGFALLYAPTAHYPIPSTKKADGGVVITSQKEQDSRVQWGLVLGLTYRCLDFRDASGFAVWIPEVTLNPSTDERSVGVGASVSWRFLKLGVGALWTKHTVLNGQAFDQLLPDDGSLRTRQSYSDVKGYFSLSVFGTPPFVP